MSNPDEIKNTSKERIEKLKAEYEQLKANARNEQTERKAEIEQSLAELENLKSDLESKYNQLENFGSTALDEITKAFFTSADAFSDTLNKTKGKIK